MSLPNIFISCSHIFLWYVAGVTNIYCIFYLKNYLNESQHPDYAINQ